MRAALRLALLGAAGLAVGIVAAAGLVLGVVLAAAMLLTEGTPDHDGIELPYDATPTWSPDGKRLAFLRQGERRATVHVVDVETGRARELGEGSSHDWTLDWSPDGARLAFVSDRDEAPLHRCPPQHQRCESYTTAELYVTDVRTGASTRLSHNGVNETSPAWSPDGTRIAFVSGRDRPAGQFSWQDVYVLDMRSGRVERLTADERNEEALDWTAPEAMTFESYDGTRFRLPVEGGPATRIGRADLTAELERVVSPAGAVAFTTARDENGRSCYFDSEWVCTPNHELYVRPAGTDVARRVTRTRHDERDLSWSPDGRTLAFASGARIWLVAGDGRGLRRLSQ